jgi:hypothetical protein
VLLVIALIGELVLFLNAAIVVGRPRPAVPIWTQRCRPRRVSRPVTPPRPSASTVGWRWLCCGWRRRGGAGSCWAWQCC